MGLEGIVSKREDSAYRSGRSADWLKMKNANAPAGKREAPRAALFLQIDHFVMAITSAEAILWHTTLTNGSNYRMLRVSPLEPQCLNSRAALRGGSGSRLR
jgi:hypothetical protein